MSFTSNSWKQSGGINRTKNNQNIKANQMAPSNLNITEKLGVENSITPCISQFEASPSTFLYNFQNGKNFNNNIAYFPFNKEINPIGISNESLNSLLYIPSNFDLKYQGSGNNLSLVSSPFNQSATQFSQNAKTIISDFSYNTQNIFGNDPGNSVSYAITVASYIYVSSDASNFCFFGMDNSNQTALTNNGNINTGISNESFYLWYPDNDGKATIYYTTISPASGTTYGFSSQIPNVLYDQWHILTVTLNGQYVYINQNGKTIFTQPFSAGTRVPNQPIAINLSSKYYDSTTNTVKSNVSGSTNNGIIQLLDYNIFNYSADPSSLQQIKDFRDSIQNINNSSLPNRDLYLNYTIGEDINYLSSKIIAGNGIGNNGSLTNFGEFNNFSRANFYDMTTFYGPVAFDSSSSIIYDSSINSTLEIYTLPGKAGQVTSSFLIENAGGGVPNYSFNPTMVVYNGTSSQITKPLTTQGLVFSISGENVSVGDIFGTHTFDVSGDTSISGYLDLGSGFSDGKINISSQILQAPIAIGYEAGNANQNIYSIAMGFQAGQTNQNYNSIAIGVQAGYQDQSANCIAIGDGAGMYSQNQFSIAIGTDAGNSTQSNNAIAMGFNAGLISQNKYAIAIGRSAGSFWQNEYSIAIGDGAGYQDQSANSIAIGRYAGYQDQSANSIAMGYQAGYQNQNQYSIAIGASAGYQDQNQYSIAMGYQAGYQDQSANSIAIGRNAGQTNLGQNSIAIGYNTVNQFTTSVALGTGATTTANNQIILGTTSETVFIPGNLDISGNLSANNVGPLSDNRLLPNVASPWIQSAGSISQLNMNGYMFTRAILNYGEINNDPTGLIFGTGANTNQSDYISLVTNGQTRLHILPGGTVGINTTSPNNSYILDVNGNINVNGTINTTSDLRLKENIKDLDNSLEKICNIRGVNYNLKSDENKTKTSGVIAQEVLEHIPEAVNNMDSEKLSVNYNSIIAHLIESVKELKREIDELKSK